MIKKYIIAFIVVFIYKIIANIINLIKVNYYFSLYNDFIKNNSEEIFKHKNHAIDLFKKANINDYSIPITQYTGFNYVSSGKASIFKNFPTNNSVFVNHIKDTFNNAIGIYRGRIIECFNPIYWIDCIIFLPKNILSYLNISSESIFTKISQIFYWLLCFIWAIFQTEIIEFIKSFFTR